MNELASPRGLRIDLHTHSNVSDGTDSPAELVAAAKHAGLDVIALTDHDTFAGLPAASQAGQLIGVEVLVGIEISTNLDGRTVHLLGYGCRVDDPDLNLELQRMVTARTERVPRMLGRLAELGMVIDADVLAHHSDQATSVGRPHIADALIELGYVADRSEAFERYLGAGRPGYVERYMTDVKTAIKLVQGAGGVAVLAHGLDADRGDGLTEAQIVELITDHDLDGLEVQHPMHGQTERQLLRDIAVRYDRVQTGSSDYHGSGKIGHELAHETTDPDQYQRLLELIAARSGQGFIRL